MTEYRLAKGWRILTYTLAPPLILLFVYVMSLPFAASSPYLYFLVPVSLAMICLFVYGILDAYSGRVIIADDRVIVKSPFAVRMLMTTDIKGFKIDEHYFHLIPADEGKKKVKISTYVGRSDEILEWLANQFDNLDVNQMRDEEKDILENDEFGTTEETRARRLREARKVASAVNGLSWLIMAWVLFYPKPYDAAIVITCLFPLIIMAITYRYRGLIKANDIEKSAYPSMAIGFIITALSLTIRVLFDFSILRYSHGLSLMGLMAIVLCALYVWPSDEWKLRKVGDYVFIGAMLLIMYAYSFGICLSANCMLDNSEGQHFNATVLEKTVSKGKTYTYYVKLTPWGDLLSAEKVKVSREEFEIVSEGQPVTVVQREGYLEMPWVYLIID